MAGRGIFCYQVQQLLARSGVECCGAVGHQGCVDLGWGSVGGEMAIL